MIKRSSAGKVISMCRVGLAGLAGAAMFAPAAAAQNLQDWLNQSTMTGDWNGARTRLANDGITFKLGYVGEFAEAMSGGERQGNGYAQALYYGTHIDLGKLAGLDGTALEFAFNTHIGHSVSAEEIGNQLAVQEIYGGGETTRVTAISLEHTTFDKRLFLKAGFFVIGNEFAYSTLGCTFQNLGFCAHPQNVSHSSGLANNPQGRWGGLVELNVTPDLYVKAGVFDSNPTYTEHGNGLKVSLSGSTGALFPVELGYKVMQQTLPGFYRVGGYYDTSRAQDVTSATEFDKGRFGFYFLAEQMLVSFGGPKRGLLDLTSVSYSDPSTATFRGSMSYGLIAQGAFAARPDDYINIGYTRAILNQRAIDAKETASDGTLTDLSSGEGVIEAGYGFQATPWLMLHPNLQYVMNPGTFSYKHFPNAWVFGFTTKAKF